MEFYFSAVGRGEALKGTSALRQGRKCCGTVTSLSEQKVTNCAFDEDTFIAPVSKATIPVSAIAASVARTVLVSGTVQCIASLRGLLLCIGSREFSRVRDLSCSSRNGSTHVITLFRSAAGFLFRNRKCKSMFCRCSLLARCERTRPRFFC